MTVDVESDFRMPEARWSRRHVSHVAESSVVLPPCPGPRFALRFANNRTGNYDFNRVQPPSLASDAADVVWNGYHRAIAYRNHGSTKLALKALILLCEHLKSDEIDRPVGALCDVTVADINNFEHFIFARRGSADAPAWRLVNALNGLLRTARALGRNIRDDVATRCLTTSRAYSYDTTSKVREPYSDGVIALLRDAAQRDAVETAERLIRGKALSSGWADDDSGFSQVVNWLATEGPLDARRAAEIERRWSSRAWTLRQAYDQVFPSVSDHVAFVILIAIETGLPIECVRSLRADCMESSGAPSGRANLKYVKTRKNDGGRVHRQMIEDDDLWSVGGMIRQILGMTSWARAHAPDGFVKEQLFIAHFHNRIGCFGTSSDSSGAFRRRHPELVFDDGTPLATLSLSRIRKTVKRTHWLQADGDLRRMRLDNRPATLLRHYVLLDELRLTHENVIEEGINAALDAATGPRVLDAAASRFLEARPVEAAPMLGLNERQAVDISSGDAGVWIASCVDNYDSPFSEPGEACGCPVWGCLDCKNAVFTESKLPGLLKLLGHLTAKRQAMATTDWLARYGFAYTRVRQILAKFDVSVLQREIGQTHEFDALSFDGSSITYRVIA